MTDLTPFNLRVARENDAAAIQAIYAPIVSGTAISFETIPPSVEEMASRIRTILQRYPYLVCEREGHVVGYAYAGAHRERAAYQWSVDVTVYVAESARRSGVGQKLYTLLFGTLARQGFHAAYAGVTLPNAGSVGLHESLGFEPVGVYREVGFKHGQWHDVGWWRRPLNAQEPPVQPVPFADLDPTRP